MKNLIKNYNWSIILIAGLLIYCIHMLGYVTAYLFQDPTQINYGAFSILTTKGDMGYTFDLAQYAIQIKDCYLNGFSLFQRDPFIFENANKYFPNGSLIYVLASLPLFFTSNLNAIFFLDPLISLLISVMIVWLIFVNQHGRGFLDKNVHIFLFTTGILLLTTWGSAFNFLNVKAFLNGVPILPRDLGYIGRFPHIEFGIFLLLFWFYRLTKIFNVKNSFNAILLGISLAVLQYSYFYFWTAAIVFTFLTICFKGHSRKQLFMNLFVVFGIYSLLTAPFWLKFINFTSQEFAADYVLRTGKDTTMNAVFNHPIVFISACLLIFDAVYCFFKWPYNGLKDLFKQTVKESSTQIALFLTALFLLNIQLIIAYTMQPYHWLKTFYYPILILICGQYLAKITLLSEKKNNRKLNFYLKHSAVIFLVLVVAAAGINNFMFGKRWAKYFFFTKTENELIHFLNTSIPSQSVIMSNSVNLLGIIKANTEHKIFVPDAFLSYSSDKEILERVIKGYSLMGYDKEDIKNELKKGEKLLPIYKYDINRLREPVDHDLSSTIPDNYFMLRYMSRQTYYNRETWNFEYSEKLNNLFDQVYNELKTRDSGFKLDYLVIFKRLKKSKGSVINTYKRIFENRDFDIYEI